VNFNFSGLIVIVNMLVIVKFKATFFNAAVSLVELFFDDSLSLESFFGWGRFSRPGFRLRLECTSIGREWI